MSSSPPCRHSGTFAGMNVVTPSSQAHVTVSTQILQPPLQALDPACAQLDLPPSRQTPPRAPCLPLPETTGPAARLSCSTGPCLSATPPPIPGASSRETAHQQLPPRPHRAPSLRARSLLAHTGLAFTPASTCVFILITHRDQDPARAGAVPTRGSTHAEGNGVDKTRVSLPFPHFFSSVFHIP